MAATFEFDEWNGAGSTQTHGRTEFDFKSIDDTTTGRASAPITAGQNSFEKWLGGHFSGTWNTISNGFWAHTAGAYGSGLTVKGQKSMAADSDRMAYATPSQSTNANLTVDMTSVTTITSGQVIWFGPTSPWASGKLATTTPGLAGSSTVYTNGLVMQLQTTAGAGAGDSVTAVYTLRYDEN